VIDKCCMCKKNGESVDHLLLHCDAACVLWNAIFSRFSLFWVMHVFSEFHNRRQFEKSFNATFVSLIPKKADAVDVKDFRPINLVGGVYKLSPKPHL
jgi:hypothetical protein